MLTYSVILPEDPVSVVVFLLSAAPPTVISSRYMDCEAAFCEPTPPPPLYPTRSPNPPPCTVPCMRSALRPALRPARRSARGAGAWDHHMCQVASDKRCRWWGGEVMSSVIIPHMPQRGGGAAVQTRCIPGGGGGAWG